jgi:hypothetical protein
MTSSRIRVFIGPLIIAPALLLALATQAQASCAGSPSVSNHVFVGTVTSLANNGRAAQVRTADGHLVQVEGSPVHDANSATSVDRTYAMGVTYEFHPVNGTSPYQDDICTSTHAIASPARTVTASAAPAKSASSWWWAAGAGLLAAAVGLLVWRRLARRRPGV